MTIEPAALTPLTFTPDRTRSLLTEAARTVGIQASDAVLLRHQSNAVYHLPGMELVAKISRPDDHPSRPGRTVKLARWLQRAGVPVVEPADLPQPVDMAGCAITFWRYLPQSAERPVTAADIAPLLRQLHSVRDRPPMPLPPLDALTAIRTSIAKAHIISDDERLYLSDRLASLEERLATPSSTSPALIHGDAQHRNTLLRDGAAVLADLESTVIGPPEWDLVTLEVHCRRFGHPVAEYRAFAATYGADVRDAPGFGALRDLRELRMITTNARKATPGTLQAAEVRKRIGQLRANDLTGQWQIL